MLRGESVPNQDDQSCEFLLQRKPPSPPAGRLILISASFAAICFSWNYTSSLRILWRKDASKGSYSPLLIDEQQNERKLFQFFKRQDRSDLMNIPKPIPSSQPSVIPSYSPTENPSYKPTVLTVPLEEVQPTKLPTTMPTPDPSSAPTKVPSTAPSILPTVTSSEPSRAPSGYPSQDPTLEPTDESTIIPTGEPTPGPTSTPTATATTSEPTNAPTQATPEPSQLPTSQPSGVVVTLQPSRYPTFRPLGMRTPQPSQDASDAQAGVGTTPVPTLTTPQPTMAPTDCIANRTVEEEHIYVFFEQFDTTLASDELLESAFFAAYANNTDVAACHPLLLEVQRVSDVVGENDVAAEVVAAVGDQAALESSELGIFKTTTTTTTEEATTSRQQTLPKQAAYAELIVLTERIEFKTLSAQVDSSGLFLSPVIRGKFVGAMNEFFSKRRLPIYTLGVKEMVMPTLAPTYAPHPSMEPTSTPTTPSFQPTASPTTQQPSTQPSDSPTTSEPTNAPTEEPTSATPTFRPTSSTSSPSNDPTYEPSSVPTKTPSTPPTRAPSPLPTESPSTPPTSTPSNVPTGTRNPPGTYTSGPASVPRFSWQPTMEPSALPTWPALGLTNAPTTAPTRQPSLATTISPSSNPTITPTTEEPSTDNPTTREPTSRPSRMPTPIPTSRATTEAPTATPTTVPPSPSPKPTDVPSASPSRLPNPAPSKSPIRRPSTPPSAAPTGSPSGAPSRSSFAPTANPSVLPTGVPTPSPSSLPSYSPSAPPAISSPTPSSSSSPTSRPSISFGPTSSPSSQPSYSPDFVLREPQLNSVQMILRGVPLLPSRSQLVWIEATEAAIKEEVVTILNNQVESVDVRVKIVSQNPEQLAAQGFQQSAARNRPPNRSLQETQGSSSSATDTATTITATSTTIIYSDLTITFDVEFSIRAVIEDHNTRRYVGAALDTPGDQAVYMFQLQSSGEEAFENLSSIRVILPSDAPTIIIGQVGEDTETLATGMTVGIAVVSVAGAALIMVGVYMWTTRKQNHSQASEEQLVGNLVEYDDNDHLSFAVMEKPDVEVSTLGDPIPQGVAAGPMDVSLAEDTASLPYDYKVAAQTLPSLGESASYTYSELSSNIVDMQTDDDTLDAQYAMEDQIEVDAPPGLLGLVLEEDAEGVASVYDMKELSPLADRINIGDKLVSVDSIDISAMPVHSVMKLIASRQNNRVRRLVFSRPTRKLMKRSTSA